MAFDLAAPHTWPAALMPLLVAVGLAHVQGAVSFTLTLDMLVIVVLMQSSVNTFNDYFDFKKGTDDASAFVDEDDAVLVYNNVNPRVALRLGIAYLALAFLLGVYPVMVAGPAPLVIAAIAAAFVVLYSGGKTPISYLPLGELISGFVMGGLIPLAAFCVLTGKLDFLALAWAIPEIIGVGLIMLTNNISDIERDVEAGRKTLPVLLGRPHARCLYKALVVLWLCSICIIVAICFSASWIMLPFMLLASYPLVSQVFANSFKDCQRQRSMPLILNLNLVLGAFYALAIFASPSLSLVL